MVRFVLLRKTTHALVALAFAASLVGVAQAEDCPAGYKACGESNQLCCPV